MHKEIFGHGRHEYQHGSGKWGTRFLYAGFGICAIIAINKMWPYIRLIPHNLEGVGAAIAATSAATLALSESVRREKAGKLVFGLGIVAGLTIVYLTENQGLPSDNEGKKETTTTTVPGPEANQASDAQVIRVDGRMVIKLPSFVNAYGCSEAEAPAHTVQPGDTTLGIINRAYPGEGSYSKVQQERISDALKAANPAVNIDLIYPNKDVIDVNCPAPTTTTTAAFVTSSTIEMAWGPMNSAQFAAAA